MNTATHRAFVLRTYPALLLMILRRVRDRAPAEDLAQSAYEAVPRHPDFDPSRPDALGYIRRRAHWLIQTRWRQTGRNVAALPVQVADPRAGQPDQALEHEEARARVRRGVAKLPESYRDVMTRHLD